MTITGIDLWVGLGVVAWIAAAWFHRLSIRMLEEDKQSHRTAGGYYAASRKLLQATGEAMALHNYGAHDEARQMVAEAMREMEQAASKK